jgi:hypothetical protein
MLCVLVCVYVLYRTKTNLAKEKKLSLSSLRQMCQVVSTLTSWSSICILLSFQNTHIFSNKFSLIDDGKHEKLILLPKRYECDLTRVGDWLNDLSFTTGLSTERKNRRERVCVRVRVCVCVWEREVVRPRGRTHWTKGVLLTKKPSPHSDKLQRK